MPTSAEPSGLDTVLLVEDDDDIRETTALVLQQQGFLVRTAPDGLRGYELACSAVPDIAVVDIAMPGIDGLSLTKRLTEERRCPVILLTARDLASDVVLGLGVGADDYITKPFDGQVLAARIRTVLRRLRGSQAERDHIGDLVVDRAAMSVHRDGVEIPLTATEFRILSVLLEHRGSVLSRSQILERVWGSSDWGEGRAVDVNVQRLRLKVGADAIVTMRGVGYRIPAP